MVVHLEANGLEARSGRSIDIHCSVATRPFSMSGSLESRFVFGFSFHRALLLLLLGSRRMLFSTGFLSALLVSLSEARCRLGFSRRIDAAIYRPAWKAKTRSQSSEHGVVATREHRHSSGSFWVKGDVT